MRRRNSASDNWLYILGRGCCHTPAMSITIGAIVSFSHFSYDPRPLRLGLLHMKPRDWHRLCEEWFKAPSLADICAWVPKNRESVRHIAKQAGIDILIGLV